MFACIGISFWLARCELGEMVSSHPIHCNVYMIFPKKEKRTDIGEVGVSLGLESLLNSVISCCVRLSTFLHELETFFPL